jgi:large subunit ribosomal protein L29
MAESATRAKDLRAVPAADLAAQLAALRQQLWQHRLKARDGSLQQTHQLPMIRRQIARIQTVLREGRGQA